MGNINGNSTPHASSLNAHQAGSWNLKPPKTFEEQADLLVDKGFSLDSLTEIEIQKALQNNNYYRLSGYWLTFVDDDKVVKGTDFQNVLDIISFDDSIRAYLIKMIEPIELKLRTQIAYHVAHKYGADALTNRRIYDKKHAGGLVLEITRSINVAERNKVPCILHNLSKYNDVPAWAVVEIISLGVLSKIYGALSDEILKDEIASSFGVKTRFLASWMSGITYIRNLCAHYSRLYNTLLTHRVMLYNKPTNIDNFRVFSMIYILFVLHSKNFNEDIDNYFDELVDIVEMHKSVDISHMGFPNNWKVLIEDVINKSRKVTK